MKNIKRNLLLSIIYCTWFLFWTAFVRTDENIVYGYIIAWCTSLWLSSLLEISLSSMVICFFIFFAIYLIDALGKFYFFTTPKQIEGFTLFISTIMDIVPILINFNVQHLMKKVFFKNRITNRST